jgi:hypothetical protein
MKIYVENKLLQRIGMILLIAWTIGLAMYFTLKYVQFDKEMTVFKKNEVLGIVIGLKDLTRGSCYLDLLRRTVVTHYALPNFKQYIDKVQIGDSLYKPVNSAIFQLYKKKGEGFSFGGTLKIEY